VTASIADARARAREVDVAYRAIWLAVLFDVLAFGIGFGWDREWHLTHPFEDFFSPPHIFIYTMHFFATLTLAYIAFTPSLRAVFGPAFTLFPLPFPVPGPIAIAGGGFVVTALAGVFDGIWHTRFGLDETNWSFPHSMLGAGIFVAFVGISACRWAIRDAKPIGLGSALVFGFLLLATAGERWTGPIGNNLSAGFIEFVANIPVLAAEPAFQHTSRIYLAFDIHRGNPLFVPLASLSAGMALALVRAFDPRPLVMLVLTVIATRLTTFVPFIAPGLVLALVGSRPASRGTWILAGIAFALLTAIIWRANGASALLGILLFPVGVWLGQLIWSVVERPTRGRVLAFVILAGIVYPAFTGIIDLSLRARVQ
jgi:hypothetical protein